VCHPFGSALSDTCSVPLLGKSFTIIALRTADRLLDPCGRLRITREELAMDAVGYPNVASHRLRSVTVHARDLQGDYPCLTCKEGLDDWHFGKSTV
jgi:hypothetical protein